MEVLMGQWDDEESLNVTKFDPAESSSQSRPELKTALEYCIWVVLLGPLAQVFLWAAVEGLSVTTDKLVHRYAIIFVHFLFYTPLFGGALVAIRGRVLRPNWLVIGFGGAGLAMFSSLCAVGLLIALGAIPVAGWRTALLFSSCAGVGMTGLVLGIKRLYHSAVSSKLYARSQQLGRERAHSAAVEAQWNSLESRVHPHFLFNTLSSIRELMHRDVAKADIMIQRFASLIRFSLDSSRNTMVPLAEELQTVTQYLEIEKMRLGLRLTYRVTMEPACAAFTIPALSVLTLVENSVKHAVACRRSGGMVEIDAQAEGGHLRVDVCDDGAGFDESSILPGHGLDLLLRRLESLYEVNTASLLLPGADGDVRVTLLIPTGTCPGVPPRSLHHEQTSLLPR